MKLSLNRVELSIMIYWGVMNEKSIFVKIYGFQSRISIYIRKNILKYELIQVHTYEDYCIYNSNLELLFNEWLFFSEDKYYISFLSQRSRLFHQAMPSKVIEYRYVKINN